MSSERISTGVDAIDRELSGGLQPGTVVGLAAPAASQSEAILNSVLLERETLYLSTLRTEPVIRDELDGGGFQLSDISITHVGVTTPLKEALDEIEKIDGQVNVVIDSMNALEDTDSHANYISFLNSLKTHMVNTGSIAMLHCLTDRDPPYREDTFSMVDAIWRLDLRDDGTALQNRLMVPKIRGEDRPDDIISLDLGREVQVDLSRDIA
jgi:KaiC/GvpD/RAD55 family RecA-like ATPase